MTLIRNNTVFPFAREWICVFSIALFFSLPVCASSGQDSTSTITQSPRPYVLILPGILGEQVWDRNIKAGIKNSNFDGDVEIYDWTRGPLAIGLNMGGNARQTNYLANRISEFKRLHPNRPLFLIGHSGGCRMAVLTMEGLPANCLIEKSILLSPCMDSYYDLRSAMNHSRSGIAAFNSPLDVPISLPLTAVQGLTQGKIKMSAAVFGFRIPSQIGPAEKLVYQRLLVQKQYRPKMLGTGHIGGHFGWTVPEFVSRYIVPDLTNSR